MAEREGFEPPEGYKPSTVFKTAAFNRSAISPVLLDVVLYESPRRMQPLIPKNLSADPQGCNYRALSPSKTTSVETNSLDFLQLNRILNTSYQAQHFKE